jgi:hypothetical protein
MQREAILFDFVAVTLYARSDMNVVTRALRGKRHRQTVRQEVPILGDEVHQSGSGSRSALHGRCNLSESDALYRKYLQNLSFTPVHSPIALTFTR